MQLGEERLDPVVALGVGRGRIERGVTGGGSRGLVDVEPGLFETFEIAGELGGPDGAVETLQSSDPGLDVLHTLPDFGKLIVCQSNRAGGQQRLDDFHVAVAARHQIADLDDKVLALQGGLQLQNELGPPRIAPGVDRQIQAEKQKNGENGKRPAVANPPYRKSDNGKSSVERKYFPNFLAPTHK